MPEPSASTGSRVAAAAVALLLAVGGTTIAVRALRSDGSGPAMAVIDPAAVCGFTPHHGPEYVSLDGLEIPRSVLDQSGMHFSELPANVVGDLRPFIAHGGIDAAHPPEDGWRIIDQGADGATVAAPNGHDWYVLRIDSPPTSPTVGGWAPYAEVLPTAADRGSGLRLVWDGTIEVHQGDHPQMHLEAVNDGGTAWKDDRGEYWGITHVFDPATGRELFPNAQYGIAGVGRKYDVPPDGRFDVPVAAPPRFNALPPGTYALVACVPELSLASPVGELRVLGDTPSTSSSPDVTILVAKPQNGPSAAAVGGGTLTVVDGCLALGVPSGPPSFVIWPVGSGLTQRDGQTWVTDPNGDVVAQVGTSVRLGGGFIGLSQAESLVDGAIPESCTVNGERYFLAGEILLDLLNVAPGDMAVSDPLGYAFVLPETWSVQDTEGSDGRTTMKGTLVSSVPLPEPSDTEVGPDASALPTGEVALAITSTYGGPSPVPAADTPLPLRYEDFALLDSCCGWDRMQRFTMGGTEFTLWIGGEGNGLTRHEDELRAIVASIRPASG